MKNIILLASDISKFGGIQKFTGSFLDALAREFPDTKIVVFSLNDSSFDGTKFPVNVDIYCFKGSRTRLIIKMLNQITLEKPDFIICGHVNFSKLSLLIKFIFKIPYVVITYGKEVWSLKWGLKYLGLKRADFITSLSRYTLLQMVDNGIPEAKISILWATVDTDFFIPQKPDPALVAELDLEGKKVLLSVSRLMLYEQLKGHAQVLKTLQLLGEDYVWIIVGSGDLVPWLKEQARKLGVTHKVRFVGSPDASRLVDFYNLCDVFILASKKEGFGIVFLEAMSCGKPVIGGNKDGCREPLLDGELGFLVDPDDPHSIAQAIKDSFDQSDKRKDPVYLRSRVKQNFGLLAFGHRIKEIFSNFSDNKNNLTGQSPSTHKMVILTTGIFKIGGIQKFTSCLLDALAQGFSESQIMVFSLNDSQADATRFPSNIQIQCFRNARFLFAIKLFLQLWQERPDVIICGHVNFSEICLFMRFIFRIPYVVITHGIDVWSLDRGLRYHGLKNADLITTVSRYTRSKMVSQGVPEIKIVLLFNTVDTNFFIPQNPDSTLIAELGLEGKRILLTVSRLALSEKRKGHTQVLKSLQLLDDKYIWIVVGSGDGVPLLKLQAQELGIAHKVKFVESPDSMKLLNFYNLCDVFVLPSKKEGFGIVFLEAMSCGKPVIGGNKDGSQEPLMDGELGFLVDPDDHKEIAQAIESAFDLSDKRTDPVFLRTRVKETFGLEAFRDRVKEIFSQF